MIAHLLRFIDEAAAQADPIVGTYYTPGTKDYPGLWRGDCCIPNVSVYSVTGTETITDSETGMTYAQEKRKPYPGWFITISSDDPSLDTHTALVDVNDPGMVFSPCFMGSSVDSVKADYVQAEAI